MNFEFTEEQRMIRDTIRQIAKERVALRAAEIDETAEYPEDIFQLFKQYGFLGLVFPEKYGGSGAGTMGLVIAIEEVAKYCCSSALLLLLTRLPTLPISIGGTEEQKQKYLRGVATGELRAAFGLTEPKTGSDVAGMHSRAERKGDEYILNGMKRFISGSTVADFFTIFAKTDPASGQRGISGFIVPRDAPGFSIGKIDKKMGVKGVPTTELIMEDCRIPVSNLIGEENKGFKIAMESLNSLRPVVGARGLGLAQGALSYAVEYTKTREAFGKPIAELQGLQFMMADMAMAIEAARLLVYRAAWLVDQGKYTREYSGLLSMAKCFATDMAVMVASDSLQLLGGYGYVADYPLERDYRDAKQLQIVEGTNQVQRVLIARSMLDGFLRWV
ncbi:MAG: acyl-CoA dehydrogenase family protein [Chloroflexi bacterium]|nr:acyl-CoA dehydrogenase family protein [Chloroflexota bacterium]